MAEPALAQGARPQRFTSRELVDNGHQFFGTVSRGLASVVEEATRRWGQPNAYILGQEASGAFVAGARYGEGALSNAFWAPVSLRRQGIAQLELENIEIPEGTALPLGLGFDGALADVLLDELAQLLVHHVLELVEVGVGAEVFAGDFVAVHGGGEDASAGVARDGGEEVLEGAALADEFVFLISREWRRGGRRRRGFVHPDEEVG